MARIIENLLGFSFEDEEENDLLPNLGNEQNTDNENDGSVPSQFQHMKIVDFHRMDDEEGGNEQDVEGLVRTVPGARLIFKRQSDDETYEELWFYKIVPGLHSEVKIRKKILAGTDIPERQTKSEDGSQKYKVWTAGDRQFLHILGLPN